MDVIYARQSVEREDSISVDSQIELCEREVVSSQHKVFFDKGYSGKNTDRPSFQNMISLIRQGEVDRVIVYRLDRISRSVLDFASLIDEFQRNGVEFISVNEKFDTSSPIGKAMLMIIMIFAQLERETIQQRIADTYKSRSKKGFYMGGSLPYGYSLKDTIIGGVKTKMYHPNESEADVVRLMYTEYAQPQTSFMDVVRVLEANGIKNRKGKGFTRGGIRELIINPIYVRADSDIYDFYKLHGAEITSDISQFVGEYGAILYKNKTAEKNKRVSVKGHTLVVTPHKGLIDSFVWLQCRRKCLNLNGVAKPVKAKKTWLAGKIKCGYCGYAMTFTDFPKRDGGKRRYYICSRRHQTANCNESKAVRAEIIEDLVLNGIKEKLNNFQELSQLKKVGDSSAISKHKIHLTEIEIEINKLIDALISSSSTTAEYVNNKISVLDKERQEIQEEIAKLSMELYDTSSTGVITGYMDKWDDLTITDKIIVVDSLIETIHASPTEINIKWKI